MITSYRVNRDMASLRNIKIQRGFAWGLIILTALLAFEIFNYSTTEFALTDVLGQLRFAGLRWATILAIAFCGIDFAGIARLFTPEQGKEEPVEVWYLFGAWLLAAAMNATLTWWGVSIAIVNHNSVAGGAVISDTALIKIVPVFVAVMVWVIRVLIIGTFSVAGERLFSQADSVQSYTRPLLQSVNNLSSSRSRSSVSIPFKPSPKDGRPNTNYSHLDTTYHNLPMSARAVRESEYQNDLRRS